MEALYDKDVNSKHWEFQPKMKQETEKKKAENDKKKKSQITT